MSDGETHAERRNRSIRLAVVTSFLSKAGTVLLQALSMPIAIRVLGREEFGLYTTVNLTLSTVAMLQVGVGPALTHGLTKARAGDDGKLQRALGSSAFFLMAGVALLAGLALGLVLLAVPLPVIYGEEFEGKQGMLRPALWVGLLLFLMLFVLNLTERIREGHLEVAANNTWGAVGNVLAAVCVAGGVWYVPEVWFLVIAVHGSLVVAKLANTFALWRRHPLMKPRISAFDPGVARSLFGDGMLFSVCTLVPGLVEYNVFGWMVGRAQGPDDVALFGVFITMTIMQLGLVVMLSAPTWPAVAEALARDDLAWARGAAKRLYGLGSLFAVCSFVGLVAVGSWVLELWLGEEFAGLPRSLLACYGLYFVAHVWRHLNHAMMIGTGQVPKLTRIQLIESVLVTALGWLALEWGGVGPMLAVAGVTIFALTGSVLPGKVIRKLRG